MLSVEVGLLLLLLLLFLLQCEWQWSQHWTARLSLQLTTTMTTMMMMMMIHVAGADTWRQRQPRQRRGSGLTCGAPTFWHCFELERDGGGSRKARCMSVHGRQHDVMNNSSNTHTYAATLHFGGAGACACGGQHLRAERWCSRQTLSARITYGAWMTQAWRLMLHRDQIGVGGGYTGDECGDGGGGAVADRAALRWHLDCAVSLRQPQSTVAASHREHCSQHRPCRAQLCWCYQQHPCRL